MTITEKTEITPLEQFCQILKERSAENTSAAKLLFDNGKYGQVISILRQELDSLVRIVFLLNQNLVVRQHLVSQTLQNTKWTQPNSRSIITDKQVVDLTDK